MTRRGLGGTAPIDYGRGETLNDPARLDEAALLQVRRWRKPRRVFVCSMTDLFGTWVPDWWIDRVWCEMSQARQHTFLVLTKRPSRMRDWFQGHGATWRANVLPNVWLGVTIESDAYSWRANVLRQTPAAVRWISAEPLLSGLPTLDLDGIDWLVTGGESGANARPCHPEWVRDLRDRCQARGIAFFHKQWGEFCHPTQLPEDVEGSGSFVDDLLRVGRRSAGRLLDGREWNQYPDPVGGGVS